MKSFAHLPDPKILYQEHLDILSDCILGGNFTPLMRRIHLPFKIFTESGTNVLETTDQVAQAFFGLNRSLKAQGVDQYVRIATRAEYVTETRICGSHETHILRSGLRVVPPYPNKTRLEFINGQWGETIAANAILQNFEKVRLPQVTPTPKVPEIPIDDPKRT